MSEIDAIPEDIKATAKRCLNDRSLSILDSVARALLAERTACAKIAEEFGWILPMYDDEKINEATDDAACSVQAQIAEAIRNPKQQEPT